MKILGPTGTLALRRLILGPTGGRDLALTPINPAAAAAVVHIYIDETFLSDHQFF